MTAGERARGLFVVGAIVLALGMLAAGCGGSSDTKASDTAASDATDAGSATDAGPDTDTGLATDTGTPVDTDASTDQTGDVDAFCTEVTLFVDVTKRIPALGAAGDVEGVRRALSDVVDEAQRLADVAPAEVSGDAQMLADKLKGFAGQLQNADPATPAGKMVFDAVGQETKDLGDDPPVMAIDAYYSANCQ